MLFIARRKDLADIYWAAIVPSDHSMLVLNSAQLGDFIIQLLHGKTIA